MLQHFLKNAILLIVLNLLVKGTYLLVVEREVQNVLPEGDYGLYFSLLNFSLLLQLVLDFGLQLYNSRNLAANRAVLAKYFPHFLGLKIGLALAFMLSLFGLGLAIGYDGKALQLLAIVGGNQVLMSMLLFFRSNLTGMGRYRADSWVSVADKLLMLILVGGLLLLAREQLTVYTFAFAQMLSWLISLLLVGSLLFSSVKGLRPRWHWPTVRVLLRRSAPFALAVFLMTAYTRTDAVMIERLLINGKEQADHYAAAYRLLDAANMLGFLLSGLLLPMFSRLITRKEPVTELLQLSLPTVLAGSVILVVPVAIFAPELIDLLYDFGDERTARILQLLIFSFIAMCINYIYGALLGAANELKRMNVIFAIGCVFNIVGNLVVLKKYGAIGVAAVTTCTQAFIALAQAVLAHRRLQLPLSILPWKRLVIFLGLFIGLCYFVSQKLTIYWMLSFSSLLLGGGVLAFLTTLLNWKQWRKLLLNRNI